MKGDSPIDNENPFSTPVQPTSTVPSLQQHKRSAIAVTPSFTYYYHLWSSSAGGGFEKCRALLRDYVGGEGLLAELKAFLQHPSRHYKDEVRVILARIRRGELLTAEQLVEEIAKIRKNNPQMNENGDFFCLESVVFEHHLKP